MQKNERRLKEKAECKNDDKENEVKEWKAIEWKRRKKEC